MQFDILPVDFGPARELCPVCDGTGRVDPIEYECDGTCPTCDGTCYAWDTDLGGVDHSPPMPTLFATGVTP